MTTNSNYVAPGGGLAQTPPSRSDWVATTLKTAILRGELRQGQPLVERELAQWLGTSKTPVREALKVLSRSGLVVTSPYRAITVAKVDDRMIENLYDARFLLEPAALLTSEFTEATVHELRTVLDESQASAAAGDTVNLSILNRKFHRLLYSSSKNDLYVSMLDDLQDLTALVAVEGWGKEPTWPAEHDEHESMVVALERDGASEAASNLLKAHIRSAKKRLVATSTRNEDG